VTAGPDSNVNGSRHPKRHGSERRAAGHGRCRFQSAVSGGNWIFDGAHWGHTSLESGSKRWKTSASFAAGQAVVRP
jgi:hypothetical protein